MPTIELSKDGLIETYYAIEEAIKLTEENLIKPTGMGKLTARHKKSRENYRRRMNKRKKDLLNALRALRYTIRATKELLI